MVAPRAGGGLGRGCAGAGAQSGGADRGAGAEQGAGDPPAFLWVSGFVEIGGEDGRDGGVGLAGAVGLAVCGEAVVLVEEHGGAGLGEPVEEFGVGEAEGVGERDGIACPADDRLEAAFLLGG